MNGNCYRQTPAEVLRPTDSDEKKMAGGQNFVYDYLTTQKQFVLKTAFLLPLLVLSVQADLT